MLAALSTSTTVSVTHASESSSFRLYADSPNYADQATKNSESDSFSMNEGGLTWYQAPSQGGSFAINTAPKASSSSSSSSSVVPEGGTAGGGGSGGSGRDPSDVKSPSADVQAAPKETESPSSSLRDAAHSSSQSFHEGSSSSRASFDVEIDFDADLRDIVERRDSVGIPVPSNEKAIDRTTFFHHVEPHGASPDRSVGSAYISTHTYQVSWHADFYLMLLVLLMILAIQITISALIYQEVKQLFQERQALQNEKHERPRHRKRQ